MSFFQRIFGEAKQREPLQPLYRAIVAKGREPAWYRDGQVPDTLDGRFDMIAAILSLLLIRLETEGEAARRESVLLTEIFIDDMDASLRQIGIGDFVVGKHVGRMMSALGGRLGAFRAAAESGDWRAAVRRNIFRDSPPGEDQVDWVAERLRGLAAWLGETERGTILAGRLPLP